MPSGISLTMLKMARLLEERLRHLLHEPRTGPFPEPKTSSQSFETALLAVTLSPSHLVPLSKHVADAKAVRAAQGRIVVSFMVLVFFNAFGGEFWETEVDISAGEWKKFYFC